MTVRGRWAVAVVGVLAAAAVALLFWPRPSTPVDVTGYAGPHQVRLLISTPTVGAHDVAVEVTDAASAQRVVIAPVMVDMGHASAPVLATATVPGHFTAAGVEFFMSGRWDVAITVHGPDGATEVVLPVLIAP